MNWLTLPLDAVADSFGGGTPKRDESKYWGGEIAWVTPSDLPMPGAPIPHVREASQHITEIGLKACAATLLPPGTVLFSSRATIGKLGIAAIPLTTNQGFVSFVPRQGIDPKYLAYCLQHFTPAIAGLAGSTTFKEVRRGALRRVSVPVPPLSEQRRIVEILDQADALRKKCTEAEAKAARILPALFHKMFGDPATNPMGWPVVPLRDVVEIGTDLIDPNLPGFLDCPHVGGDNIEKGTGRLVSLAPVRHSDLRSAKFHFSSDHVLYSKIRPYLNKVTYPGFEGVCSADIYPLRPSDSRLTQWYLVALLRSDAFLSYCAVHSERLRIPKVNRDQLGAFPVPLPDVFALRAFETRAAHLASLDAARGNRANCLETVCLALTRGAFSGDLTKKWREAHMEELLAEMEMQARYLEPTP